MLFSNHRLNSAAKDGKKKKKSGFKKQNSITSHVKMQSHITLENFGNMGKLIKLFDYQNTTFVNGNISKNLH
jgi:hypothetical protein